MTVDDIKDAYAIQFMYGFEHKLVMTQRIHKEMYSWH